MSVSAVQLTGARGQLAAMDCSGAPSGPGSQVPLSHSFFESPSSSLSLWETGSWSSFSGLWCCHFLLIAILHQWARLHLSLGPTCQVGEGTLAIYTALILGVKITTVLV